MVDKTKEEADALVAALRASTMYGMVQNCEGAEFVMRATGGELFPYELSVIKLSMISVFAYVFDEDPDRVLDELNERVAQSPAQV
jgi:hypothetical protein